MKKSSIFFIILFLIVAAGLYVFIQKYYSAAPQPVEEPEFLTPELPIEELESKETITVQAFFNNNILDPEVTCTKVFPVERIIPKTQAVGRAALEELLKGPTSAEKQESFSTNINPDVKIQSLVIENGVAKADFDEQLQFQAGGACRVSAIRAQITETLKQFPTVKTVVISINGQTEDILQP